MLLAHSFQLCRELFDGLLLLFKGLLLCQQLLLLQLLLLLLLLLWLRLWLQLWLQLFRLPRLLLFWADLKLDLGIVFDNADTEPVVLLVWWQILFWRNPQIVPDYCIDWFKVAVVPPRRPCLLLLLLPLRLFLLRLLLLLLRLLLLWLSLEFLCCIHSPEMLLLLLQWQLLVLHQYPWRCWRLRFIHIWTAVLSGFIHFGRAVSWARHGFG